METHELFTIHTRQGKGCVCGGDGQEMNKKMKLSGARKGPGWQRRQTESSLTGD